MCSIRKNQIKKPKKSTPNLIMTLPGELRNKIYVEALRGAGKSSKRFLDEGPNAAEVIIIGTRSHTFNQSDGMSLWRNPGGTTKMVPAW